MYQPTWEKFCKKADTYLQDNTVTMIGAVQGHQFVGIIVLKEQDISGHYEILGIAVDQTLRQHGIGKQMVQYAMLELRAAELYAETDDDAVAFYRNCNFAVSTFTEEYPYGECIRHKCVLKGSA